MDKARQHVAPIKGQVTEIHAAESAENQGDLYDPV
jgi:hypothetical protein